MARSHFRGSAPPAEAWLLVVTDTVSSSVSSYSFSSSSDPSSGLSSGGPPQPGGGGFAPPPPGAIPFTTCGYIDPIIPTLVEDSWPWPVVLRAFGLISVPTHKALLLFVRDHV